MPSRSTLDRLKQTPSRTGRLSCEDGVIINESNIILDGFYSDASKMAASGRLFFTSETVSVASLASITYTLTTPIDRYVVQYARDIKVTGNIWDIETLLNGTVTGGSPLVIQNSILDVPYSGSTSFLSTTTVSGETVGATDFIAAPGHNKAGGASAVAGGTIVVYPPGGKFSLRLTNTGNDTQRVHLDYTFAEITTEELERLKGIYVIQS